jgi:hypothetical protein
MKATDYQCQGEGGSRAQVCATKAEATDVPTAGGHKRAVASFGSLRRSVSLTDRESSLTDKGAI